MPINNQTRIKQMKTELTHNAWTIQINNEFVPGPEDLATDIFGNDDDFELFS